MYAFSEKWPILFKILLKLNCNRCFYSSSVVDCILFGDFGIRCRKLSHLMNVAVIFFGQFHQKLRHRFNMGDVATSDDSWFDKSTIMSNYFCKSWIVFHLLPIFFFHRHQRQQVCFSRLIVGPAKVGSIFAELCLSRSCQI